MSNAGHSSAHDGPPVAHSSVSKRGQDSMDSVHEPQGKLHHKKPRVRDHNHHLTSLQPPKRGSDGTRKTDLVRPDVQASFVTPFLHQHPCDIAKECLPTNDEQDDEEERDGAFRVAAINNTAGHSSTSDQDYQPLDLCTKKGSAGPSRSGDGTRDGARDSTHSFRKPQMASMGDSLPVDMFTRNRSSCSDNEVSQVDLLGQSVSHKKRGKSKSLLASGHAMSSVAGPSNNSSHILPRSTHDAANLAAALALLQQQQQEQQQHHQSNMPILSIPNSEQNKPRKRGRPPLMSPPPNIDVSSAKLSMNARDASAWSNRLHAASLIQAQLAAQAASWQSILANQSVAATNPGQFLLQNSFRDAFNHHFNAFAQQQQQLQNQQQQQHQQQQQQHHQSQPSKHSSRSNSRGSDGPNLNDNLDALSLQARISQQLHQIQQQHQAQLTQHQQAKQAKLSANAAKSSSAPSSSMPASGAIKPSESSLPDDVNSDDSDGESRKYVDGKGDLNVEDLRVPLKHGWRRYTIINKISASGVKGDVLYISPEGKKLRNPADVQRYLNKGNNRKLSAKDHFSFNSRWLVGEFNQPTEDKMEHVVLTESEVINRVEELKQMRKKRLAQSHSDRRTRKPRSSSPASNSDALSVPGPSSSETHQRKLAEEDLRAKAALLMGFGNMTGLRMDRQLEQMKIFDVLEQLKRQQQIQNAEAEKLKQEEERKQRFEAKMKRELELKRQQEEQLAKEQEMQKRREMQMMAEIERERRRQHMQLVRAMDIHKRFEEREKRREEALQEKKIQQEKKMLKKRIEMELLKELKKPIEDMRLKDLKPLPTLNRIPGLKLPTKAFSDILMTYEFLHNFGDAIGLDSDSLPSLNTFQHALLNMEESAQEEMFNVLRHLLKTAIESPGLPVNMTTVVGQKLKDAPITNLNISEVLRLYFSSFVIHRASAAYGVEGRLLKLLSQNKPFVSLSPTQKAEILAYLCNELSCHPAIVKRIEENIEQVAAIRRDKWVVDCDLRKYKSIKVKRDARRAQYEAQENCAESDPDKVKDLDFKLKTLPDDSGESGPENDEHIPPVNLDAPDEEPEISNEELDKKIEKLARQCTLITNKLNKANHGLRVNSLGQDRYRRRYWVLPASGGIFVEGMESAEPEEMEANYADESCVPDQDEDLKNTSDCKDKSSSKNEDEQEKENKMDESSDTVTEDTFVKPNGIDESIDESAVEEKVEKKSSKKASKKKKKSSKRSSNRNKAKEQPEQPVKDTEQVDDVKTEEDEKDAVTADEEVNMSADEDKKQRNSSEESPVMNGTDKDQIVVKTEGDSCKADEPESKTEVAKEGTSDAPENMDTTEAQENPADQKSKQLGISHLVASALLSKQQQALKNNHQQGNSVNGNEVPTVPPKAWFSILPRVPCTLEITSEEVTSEETENVQISDSKPLGPNESLANGTLDESKPNLNQSKVTGGKLLPKDLLNLFLNGGAENIDLTQLLSLEEFSDICPSLQKRIETQKDEHHAEPVKIPLEYQYGWWRITDPAQIRSLMDSLHERASRERNLHKHLTKYHSYITTKCKSNAAEFDVTELDRKIFELCLFGAPRDSGRYSAEAALELDIAVLAEIDALEEKIAASSMQVRGWAPSKKSSEMNYNFKRKLAPFSIEDLFVQDIANGDAEDNESGKIDPDDDDEAKEDSDSDNDDHVDTLEFGKERLLNAEAMIERRYLKPPLGFKANTILVSNRHSVDEMADNAADENAPSGLLRWREAVRESRTSAQLALLTHFLESCIAWDKSIMRASCQFCASGENEAQLLLCDGCDKGYHMYCFKPKMEEVPDGDWYCFECQNKNTIDKVCIVCGKKGKLLSCESCPKVFHPNCIDPPVTKPPKGKWSCHICARKPKKS